jgi:hypothetical protein
MFSFEDLITEMAPSLSVRPTENVFMYTVNCDWVRKPTFTAVLSFKTVAFFSQDWCASRNLTFSTAVSR